MGVVVCGVVEGVVVCGVVEGVVVCGVVEGVVVQSSAVTQPVVGTVSGVATVVAELKILVIWVKSGQKAPRYFPPRNFLISRSYPGCGWT